MITISLSKLKINTLFTFCLRVYELISAKIVAEMGIDYYFNLFTRSFNKLKDALEKNVLSAAELAQFDSTRDQFWIALRTHVKNYLRHPDLTGKAQAILAEIDRYGGSIYLLPYAEETAIIGNVCTVLEERYSNELADMHATVWFNFVKEANTAFENTLRTYNEQKTNAIAVETASSVRPELEDATRKLLTFLPMQAEVTGNEALQSLVKELQVEAARF